MFKKHFLKNYARLRRWFSRIINSGVTTEVSFEELRRIRVLNLTAFLGFCAAFTFLIIHLFNGRPTLALLNIFTLAATVTLFITNNKKWYYVGQVTVSIVLTIVFTITSLLYHNGMEFYLLFITALIATVLKKRLLLQVISIVNCIIFLLLIKYGDRFQVYEPTPDNLYFTNLLIWIIFYLIFFRYFGQMNALYLANIEKTNKQLQHQQVRLIEQTRELEISNRKLNVLNSTKEKLFAIVAHDVRSPIYGLRGSLDLLNEDALSREEFIDLSRELSMQLNQLQDSLDNLLKWTNRQMKGIEIQKQNILLEPLIADSIDLLHYNLTNKNIQIDIHPYPDIFIYADPDQVKLIIRNLISNAIKFSYAGSKIELTVEQKDDFVHFSVTDNGIGMTDEVITELFSNSSFATQRGTLNEKGTGMGLKISREFAEKNGGEILIKSEPDSGCVFTLTLPAAVNEPVPG